ncbi:hypothetical protein CDAR_211631 [Caerostris darwini]|uniref:Uncharacterized protein n=1 Tax=Caerostris darwini TaxID=1538125 RepID=A0AAV4S4Z8_9ARAC|nr:hypothetical protein CDAR_211631 [Caerostris darwini]
MEKAVLIHISDYRDKPGSNFFAKHCSWVRPTTEREQIGKDIHKETEELKENNFGNNHNEENKSEDSASDKEEEGGEKIPRLHYSLG